MTNHDNDTVRVGPEAFPGTIVARHNGYTLRRETRDNGTVYWRTTRPASGHRIDYRRKAADVFSVNPERRDVYGNADTESYAHTMLAAVEAATVFAAIVRATTGGVFLPNVAADHLTNRNPKDNQ